MPIYEYQCTHCGYIEELLQVTTEDMNKPLHCLCGVGEMKRIISNSNIRFGLGCSCKDEYSTTYAKMNYKSKMSEGI